MDAICQKHNAMIGVASCPHCEIESLRQQLAAAQVACESQRDAFINTVAHLSAAASAYEKFVGRHGVRGHPDALFLTRYADFISAEKRGRDALVINPDASALRQHDEELIERCAEICDDYAKNSSNPMNFAENCATAIRELKGQ